MNVTIKVLFALMIFLSVAFAGISVSGYTVSRETFKQSDVGVITVTVTNPTGEARVTGLTLSISNPAEIAVSSAPALADIDTGGSAVVSIPIKIKADAAPGIYLMNVVFTGFTTESGTQRQLPTTNIVSIPITVVNPPILSLKTSTPLISGIDSIPLTITNDGGMARNLRISTTGSVGLYGTDEIYIGDLSGRQNISLPLDSRQSADGPLDFPILLTYEDEIGVQHTDTSYIRITVKNEVLDMGFNQVSELITRQDGTLSLEVVNNGQALSDVRLSFTNSSLRLKDVSEIKVGDLAAGEKKTVSGLVYNDLTPGLNLVNAKVDWVDRDIRKDEDVSIPITIGSDANVGVYLESKPTPLTAGQVHTISVLISNVGSYGIDNVDVGLNSSAFESLDITPRQYIGSLAKDDFSTVQFNVRMTSTPGDYPVSINVRYRDASGEWVTKTISQTASVKGAPSEEGGVLYLAIGAVIVLAAAVWFFRFRKKGPKA